MIINHECNEPRTCHLLGKVTIGSIFGAAMVMFCAQTAVAQTKSALLPSSVTKAALEALRVEEEKPLATQEIRQLQLPQGSSGRSDVNFSESGVASVPFAAPDTMILQLAPNLSQDDIEQLAEEKQFRIVDVYSNTGQIKVEADLSEYFKPRLTDDSANATILRGALEASSAFKSDPRILGASPDLFFSNKAYSYGIANVELPNAMFDSSSTTTEIVDWGVSDIEADQVWSEPGVENGVVFGVMDTGFARHEDLIFSRLGSDIPPANHGNHVAGIACAKHNGVGTRGVIPNCFVRPRVGDFAPTSPGGGNVLQFYVLFSQILKTLNDFIPIRFEVKTFNLSLGYNWMPNFGINPDDQDASQYRKLVESQGELFLSILELADEKDKVIFSAAGNDSHGLSDPMDAQFASPFNWAAFTARDRGISANGVVVEAHDQTGARASFSNEKGDLSCPGTDIVSTIALNADGTISHNLYGAMSGTSMASPYCAAAHSLLSLLRPGYSGVELVECLKSDSEQSDSGTPRVKLSEALQKCPS